MIDDFEDKDIKNYRNWWTFGKVILESLFTGAYAIVLNTPWASIGHKFYKYKDKKLITHVNSTIKYLLSIQDLQL